MVSDRATKSVDTKLLNQMCRWASDRLRVDGDPTKKLPSERSCGNSQRFISLGARPTASATRSPSTSFTRLGSVNHKCSLKDRHP